MLREETGVSLSQIQAMEECVMTRIASWFIGFFFFVSSVCSVNTLYAAPYYEGRVIKILVGSGAGGGYDRMARIVAKHLPKYIPGKPTIIVDYMPGATGIVAANYLYNSEKPDGLTIGALVRGLAFPQILKSKAAKYDMRKFPWIGSTATEATVLAVRAELPYKTVDDLRKAKGPIHLGGIGPQEAPTQFAVLLKEFAGLNLNMVYYQSSAEAMMALERKEVDARAGSYSSLKPFIEQGLVRPLIRSRASEPEIERLPVNEDLTTDKTGKTIMAMQSVVDRIGRPYVVPPGTPTNVVKILRDAFAKMAKDPIVQEESKKYMMTMKYTPADECLKVLGYLFNQPEDILKAFANM